MAEKTGLYGSEIGTNVFRSALAEFVGTFLLVFTGTAVVVAAAVEREVAGAPYNSLAVALAFGLALTIVVAAIGHVSGGHVNPAVTISLAASGNFPWKIVPAYVTAQLMGGILGAAATWGVFGASARSQANLGATAPAVDVGAAQVILTEALVTFLLVFVIVSVATDQRVHKAVAPFAVGAALACGVLIAGPVTGGAVNPARALGPMLVSGEFPAWGLYIIGPVLGGVLAGVLYSLVIAKGTDPAEAS